MKKSNIFLTLVLLVSIIWAIYPGIKAEQKEIVKWSRQPALASAYGRLPLSFEENLGQLDGRVKYSARGHRYTLYLTENDLLLSLLSPAGRSALIRMRLLNANGQARAEGERLLPGKSHYFIGADADNWCTDVKQYGSVRYRGVYDGIDLVYYGNQRQLEYDFVVAPGADARAIAIEFEGADEITIDSHGNLLLQADGGELRQLKPVIYQEKEGGRELVEGHFTLLAHNRIGFEIADYDRSRALVIDPVLEYATFIGGTQLELGNQIAIDAQGNAYVMGYTNSVSFPHTNPLFNQLAGQFDVFVTKLNAAGTAVEYSTFFGGSGSEGTDINSGRIIGIGDIAVDANGQAYVHSSTSSRNIPVVNALQPTFRGGTFDAFLFKLNAQGNELVYSTYLGGNDNDFGGGIAVDAEGNAYLTGETNSTNFPTVNAAQPTKRGGITESYVSKLNAAGTAFLYSTYLGGSGNEHAGNPDGRIAIDSQGNAYVTGITTSTNFPTVNGLRKSYGGGANDAFVTKYNSQGQYVYSTYLGGSATDEAYDIAADDAGNAYVVGFTSSANFPVVNALFATKSGGNDVFITKLNSNGSALVFSTFYGGSSEDVGYSIAVDGASRVYFTGYTTSSNFPVNRAIDSSINGGQDAFVAVLSQTGGEPVYSTYLGSTANDRANCIALDATGSVYITGITSSSQFPVTAGAAQTQYRGGGDAFIAKITDRTGSVQFASDALTVSENGSEALIEVTRTEGSEGTLTVAYASANGTASADADYSAVSGMLTFAPGVTTQMIRVPIKEDNIAESQETFTITLNSVSLGAVLGMPATVTVTIDDNEPTPQISIADTTVTEANDGLNTAIFMVTLSGPSAVPITVNFVTEDGSARVGSDYQAASGTVTFDPGTVSQTINVTVIGDTLLEADETFTVKLSNASNATIADGLAGGKIVNNDDTLPVISIDDVRVNEGNSGDTQATLTVSLAALSGLDVTFDLMTIDGTAKAGSDYRAFAAKSLVIPAGTRTKTVNVDIIGDSLDEQDETFSLTLANVAGATTGKVQGTVTVANDDGAPTLAINDVKASEGNSGITNFTFTVTLASASGKTVNVNYATANGTATAGSDYTSTSGTLTFAPGSTRQIIIIAVNGDELNELEENFFVNLTNPVNATITRAQGQGIVVNDDAIPLVQFSQGSLTVTEGGTATVTISRVNNSSGAVSVQFISNGATASNRDFNDASAMLFFANGETSKTVTVTINEDNEVEGEETITLLLSNPVGADLGLAAATLTIKDNDVAQPGRLQLSAPSYNVGEGEGRAVITVTREGGSNVPVTVNYMTSDGTAIAGSDYREISGTLSFAVGVTSQSITIPIFDDNLLEGDENIIVTLTSATGGATLGTNSRAQLVVKDNDVAEPGQFQFSAATYNIEENLGSVTVSVTRTGGSNVAAAVNYSIMDGTARTGSDFAGNTGTLNFPAGVTSQSFTISINDDNALEGDETIAVLLSGATNGAAIAQAQAQIVIIDNELQDRVPVLQIDQLAIDFGAVAIGETAQRIIMLRNGGRADLSLSQATINGFGASSFIVLSQPATFTLVPGQSVNITVGFKPTAPTRTPLLTTLSLRSNGGNAAISLRGSGSDVIAPAVSIFSPSGGETITAGRPFTIKFSGTDNDAVASYLISVSSDDGGSYTGEIARIGGALKEVIWNVPGLISSTQARIRIIARDRAGNLATAVSGRFTIAKPESGSNALQVNITFDPPPMGKVAPPQNVQVNAAPATAVAALINANTNEAEDVELIGYNIYRVKMPEEGGPLPTADEIVGDPANLVGSIGAESTSFTDMISSDQGENFIYSITSFFGGGQQSGGSQPAGTELPVIKNPRFVKGTLMLDAAGSFIKTGAMIVINNNDSYALEFDSSGVFLMVPKRVLGSGGVKLRKLLGKGRTVTMTVKNPDGKTSLPVTFTRD